ncbi:MAG TPA: efflux RND transporter periplasmic adaptor subunit [Thermoanaerobaculia bacterium]|nr:efflux RND transporter periplasmic adaptor subunit [Thermoanaerobaculia bacterium]
MRTRSRVFLISVVLLVLTGAFFAVRAMRVRKDGSEDKYRTAAVERGDVTMTVTATGTLSAVTTVQVGSQVSGVIARLYADFNSPVRRGQLLAELDPTPFEAQVEQRRADVTRSQVELRNAELTFQRQRRLQDAGLAPEADVDSARASFDSARAQLQQSQAALSQALTNLRYTRILSPIDGVVADRQYDVGQTVAASFQAPTLFTIAQDLTKMQVQADVDQSDIGRVSVGQMTRFTVDAYPEEDFRGRITQLRLNATVNQNVVSYPVIIEVENPGEKLRPNMTANVTIEVAEVKNVLRVPNAALRFRPEIEKSAGPAPAARTGTPGGGFDKTTANLGERQRGLGGAARSLDAGKRARRPPQTVYRLESGALAAVEIRTGISDGRFTEVKEGDLKPGDTIAIGPATSRVEQTGGPGSRGPRMGRF